MANKWDRHKIGKTKFIEVRRKRLEGCPFIDYAINNVEKEDFVLEIGAGELIEARKIRDIRKDINYYIFDISDTFIAYARKLRFLAFKRDMNKVKCKPHRIMDLIYMNNVLEHSPDVVKTVKMLKENCKSYYITLFKWKFKTGGLKPVWCGKKGYWSNTYNIWELLSLFGDSITEMYVTDGDNNKTPWPEYVKEYADKLDINRNYNYLNIIGEW